MAPNRQLPRNDDEFTLAVRFSEIRNKYEQKQLSRGAALPAAVGNGVHDAKILCRSSDLRKRKATLHAIGGCGVAGARGARGAPFLQYLLPGYKLIREVYIRWCRRFMVLKRQTCNSK